MLLEAPPVDVRERVVFEPASLGFPQAASQYFGANQYFPRFEMDETQSFRCSSSPSSALTEAT